MLIHDITQRLCNLTVKLSASKSLDDSIVFAVSDFVRKFGDTNMLLDEIEELMSSDMAMLREQTSSLQSAISSYSSSEKPELKSSEFTAIVEEHLLAFKTPQQQAQQRATELWRTYQSLSNRLDYLPIDSEEYRQLDAECDAAKSAYDKAHAENTLLYNRCRQEEAKWAYASFFNPQFFDILIAKLQEICEVVLEDETGKEVAP